MWRELGASDLDAATDRTRSRRSGGGTGTQTGRDRHRARGRSAKEGGPADTEEEGCSEGLLIG